MAAASIAVAESLVITRDRTARHGRTPRARGVVSSAASTLDGRLPRYAGLRAIVVPCASFVRPQGSRSKAASIVCEAQETSLSIPDVNKSTWQSLVLDSDTPVLVDFWAPWCGPCRMIEPTILNLAKVYDGSLKCYKLNTDENPDLASRYNVRSIPTVMIFKNGEKKETVIGAVPESSLISSILKFVERR